MAALEALSVDDQVEYAMDYLESHPEVMEFVLSQLSIDDDSSEDTMDGGAEDYGEWETVGADYEVAGYASSAEQDAATQYAESDATTEADGRLADY